MNPTAILFTTIVLISLVSAILYYIRSDNIPRSIRIALAGLRVLALGALILAFFEPSIMFTRLVDARPSTVVMTDVSESMNLFSADSVKNQLTAAFRAIEENSDIAPQVHHFCFGDSIRACTGHGDPEWSDGNSFFPRRLPGLTGDVENILILSDGNWSNVPRLEGAFRSANLHYLELPAPTPRPHLRARTEANMHPGPTDSTVVHSIQVSGYKTTDRPISVSLRLGNEVLSHRTLQADSGFFADTVSIAVTPRTPGIHMYEVLVESAEDSPASTLHVVHNVTRSSIQAILLGETRSLDRRFLTLALQRNTSWELRASQKPNAQTDVLLILDWNEEARQSIRELPANATVVFVGTLPCDSSDIIIPSTGATVISTTPWARLSADVLPPPTGIITCETVTPDPSATYLSVTTKRGGQGSKGIPVLYETRYMDRRILVLGATGTWRWQFWPAGRRDLEQKVGFDEFLMRTVVDLLERNANRAFRVFPDMTPLYDTDSIPFRFLLPSEFHTSPEVSVSLSLTDTAGNPAFDTIMRVPTFTMAGAVSRIPPLPTGTYRYIAGITGKPGGHTDSNSFCVLPNNAEMLVMSQNTTQLGRIAAPIAPGDTNALRRLIGSANSVGKGNKIVSYPLRIRQSWILLLTAVVLFSLEWLVRRLRRVEE